MIVRRLAARRLVKTGSTEEEPRRKRAARFLLVIFGAGTLAGTAASLGIWPFGSFQTLFAEVVPRSGPPLISAQSIFPPVQPVHKTVDVYATAPPVRRTQPTANPTDRPSQPPRPSQSPRPSGSPSPDD
jgi:hypothetical protein